MAHFFSAASSPARSSWSARGTFTASRFAWAIAGIAIAFMAGGLSDLYDKFDKWATVSNPFCAQLTPTQISPDLLALMPFAVMVAILYLPGRGRILAGRKH